MVTVDKAGGSTSRQASAAWRWTRDGEWRAHAAALLDDAATSVVSLARNGPSGRAGGDP
jgi:hypothetical protein